MISFDLANCIFMIINVLILVFLAKKFLFGRVDAIIAKRKEELDKSYQDAGEAIKEAEAVKKDYEEKLVLLEEEKTEAINKAAEKVYSERDGIIKKANDDANVILEAAREEAERITHAAELRHDKDVEEVIFSVASRLAGQAVTGEAGGSLYDQFLGEAEGQIGNGK